MVRSFQSNVLTIDFENMFINELNDCYEYKKKLLGKKESW